MNMTPVPLRIDDSILERVAKLAERMAAKVGGVRISKQDVLRLAIERGLEVLEREIKTRK